MLFSPKTYLRELQEELDLAYRRTNIPYDVITSLYKKFCNFYYGCDKLELEHVKLLTHCCLRYIDCVQNYIDSTPALERTCMEALQKYISVVGDVSKLENVKNAYFLYVTIPIFEKITEPDITIWFSKELLKNFNFIVNGTRKHIRHTIVANHVLHLCKLADMIHTCGDYDHQAMLLEAIFRMCSNEQIAQYSHDLFPTSSKFKNKFCSIDRDHFDRDVRAFLNTLNSELKKVLSLNCEVVQLGNMRVAAPKDSDDNELPIWVDFNLGTSTITIFCSRDSLKSGASLENDDEADDEDNVNEIITVNVADVGEVFMSKFLVPDSPLPVGSIILFNMTAPCSVTYPSSAEATKATTLKVAIYKCAELNELLTKLLPQWFGENFKCFASTTQNVNQNRKKGPRKAIGVYKSLELDQSTGPKKDIENETKAPLISIATFSSHLPEHEKTVKLPRILIASKQVYKPLPTEEVAIHPRPTSALSNKSSVSDAMSLKAKLGTLQTEAFPRKEKVRVSKSPNISTVEQLKEMTADPEYFLLAKKQEESRAHSKKDNSGVNNGDILQDSENFQQKSVTSPKAETSTSVAAKEDNTVVNVDDDDDDESLIEESPKAKTGTSAVAKNIIKVKWPWPRKISVAGNERRSDNSEQSVMNTSRLQKTVECQKELEGLDLLAKFGNENKSSNKLVCLEEQAGNTETSDNFETHPSTVHVLISGDSCNHSELTSHMKNSDDNLLDVLTPSSDNICESAEESEMDRTVNNEDSVILLSNKTIEEIAGNAPIDNGNTEVVDLTLDHSIKSDKVASVKTLKNLYQEVNSKTDNEINSLLNDIVENSQQEQKTESKRNKRHSKMLTEKHTKPLDAITLLTAELCSNTSLNIVSSEESLNDKTEDEQRRDSVTKVDSHFAEINTSQRSMNSKLNLISQGNFMNTENIPPTVNDNENREHAVENQSNMRDSDNNISESLEAVNVTSIAIESMCDEKLSVESENEYEICDNSKLELLTDKNQAFNKFQALKEIQNTDSIFNDLLRESQASLRKDIGETTVKSLKQTPKEQDESNISKNTVKINKKKTPKKQKLEEIVRQLKKDSNIPKVISLGHAMTGEKELKQTSSQEFAAESTITKRRKLSQSKMGNKKTCHKYNLRACQNVKDKVKAEKDEECSDIQIDQEETSSEEFWATFIPSNKDKIEPRKREKKSQKVNLVKIENKSRRIYKKNKSVLDNKVIQEDMTVIPAKASETNINEQSTFSQETVLLDVSEGETIHARKCAGREIESQKHDSVNNIVMEESQALDVEKQENVGITENIQTNEDDLCNVVNEIQQNADSTMVGQHQEIQLEKNNKIEAGNDKEIVAVGEITNENIIPDATEIIRSSLAISVFSEGAASKDLEENDVHKFPDKDTALVSELHSSDKEKDKLRNANISSIAVEQLQDGILDKAPKIIQDCRDKVTAEINNAQVQYTEQLKKSNDELTDVGSTCNSIARNNKRNNKIDQTAREISENILHNQQLLPPTTLREALHTKRSHKSLQDECEETPKKKPRRSSNTSTNSSNVKSNYRKLYNLDDVSYFDDSKNEDESKSTNNLMILEAPNKTQHSAVVEDGNIFKSPRIEKNLNHKTVKNDKAEQFKKPLQDLEKLKRNKCIKPNKNSIHSTRELETTSTSIIDTGAHPNSSKQLERQCQFDLFLQSLETTIKEYSTTMNGLKRQRRSSKTNDYKYKKLKQCESGQHKESVNSGHYKKLLTQLSSPLSDPALEKEGKEIVNRKIYHRDVHSNIKSKLIKTNRPTNVSVLSQNKASARKVKKTDARLKKTTLMLEKDITNDEYCVSPLNSCEKTVHINRDIESWVEGATIFSEIQKLRVQISNIEAVLMNIQNKLNMDKSPKDNN